MKLLNLKNILIAFAVIISINTPLLPQLASAQSTAEAGTSANGDECEKRILGIPPWYRGLTNADCSIKSPESGTVGLSNFIWHIVLNVIEAAMTLIGYLSVIFIIYGGVLYITSAGDSKGVEKAKSSIANAVIGLVISIVAVAIVEFIFSKLGAM